MLTAAPNWFHVLALPSSAQPQHERVLGSFSEYSDTAVKIAYLTKTLLNEKEIRLTNGETVMPVCAMQGNGDRASALLTQLLSL